MRALPHDYGADGTFRRIPLGKADANMHPGGGHFATPRDLARFAYGSGPQPADVFDARRNQLRVNFTGDAEVVEFAFPAGGGSARALQYRGETFERVKD